MNQKKINIYVGKKVVGYVQGKIFHKDIIESRHLLRKPPAIAFDVDSLNQVYKAGAEWIAVFGKETGTVYLSAIGILIRYGIPIDRGYGFQCALPIKYWQRCLPSDIGKLCK